MRVNVLWLLFLAHAVCAITGPRTDNDFDRRRQISLGHPGFSEHQTRFGINSPLQSFQQQPGLLISPTPSPLNFQHNLFQQPQQPYVPQFGFGPTQSLQNQNLQPALQIPSNNFQFNQVPSLNAPVLQNNFQQQRPLPQPQQPILPQPSPTIPTFSNNFQNHQPPAFNPNSGQTVNIGQQRPTQPPFLPTIPPVHNQQTFSHSSPITIQQAPNLGPQNPQQNNNVPQNVAPQTHHQVSNAQQNLAPQIQPQLNNQQFHFQQTPQFQNNQPSHIIPSIPTLEQQSKENLEKLNELQERQRIIQKHQEFVQKQQQKQQEKVEKLHEEFLSKQATKTVPTIPTTERYFDDYFFRNQDKRRPILPHETDLFRKAVELYEKEHPTTTTSTTTTTTTTTTTRAPPPRYTPRTKPKTRGPPQDRNKAKLYNEIKNLLEESETKGFDDSLRAKSVALLQKPDILKQLKVALAENPEDFSEKNFTSREINVNGQKFEVIRTNNPNLIPKGAITADASSLARIMASTAEPQKESRIDFSDFTKGVLPPGADFELIKQSENGKLEEVKIPSAIQSKKKVTFVFLEEQDDGTYKVKGVKANGQQTEEGPEVENILNKIKNGEIQLPGQTKISNSIFSSTTASPTTEATDYVAESSHHPSSYSSFVTTSNHGSTGHTNPIHTTPAPNTYHTSISSILQSTRAPTSQQSYSPSSRNTVSTTERTTYQSTTASTFLPTRKTNTPSQRSTFPSSTTVNTTPFYRSTPGDLVVIGSSTIPPSFDSTISQTTKFQSRQSNPSLVDILKENGLFATAKYLRQSGLDTILNETGPYTIFAPTDKAFRTLLVQLGGPDRAEEKFRDNPRLLSGLLLHHVIPGAFDIGSLQDEMTGVSLAGTQLRVNQYDMHDVEWNEVRVTTINGARVLEDKKDIHIPQGIAHAVDRVMFPLPVGDLVQTLQADRDRRFTTFLKAIFASGFADTLAESKTYTIFAPTDAAFARLSPTELARYADKAAARALVARHVLPGTLYSAGMRYYQLRNSMEDAKPLTLQKSSGRIKVNNASVVTHNIPATNGVIHAIDTLL